MARRSCIFSLALVLSLLIALLASGFTVAAQEVPGQSPADLELPVDNLTSQFLSAASMDAAVILYTTAALDPDPLPAGVNIQSFFYPDTVKEHTYIAESTFTGSQYTFSLVLASSSSTSFAAELIVNDQVVAMTESTTSSTTYTRFETSVAGTPINVGVGDSVTLRLKHVSGGRAGMLSAAPPNGTFIAIADAVQAVPELTISAHASEVSEGDDTATFDVSLSRESESEVSVDLQVAGGTATSGQDFALQTTSLTFGPGETTRIAIVNLIDDPLDEVDELFTIAITNPTNAELGEEIDASVRILDNDEAPSLNFDRSSASVQENQGSIALSIVADAPSSRLMTVTLGVSGGDATPGVDFVFAQQTVEFSPGQTTRQVTLQLLDDDVREETETILVSLSNPTNSQLGDSSSMTITINDDDGVSESNELFAPMLVDGTVSTPPPTPPSAPVLNAIVNPTGGQSYTVSWDAGDGATDYTLEEDDSVSFASPTVAYSGASLAHSVSGHAPGTYFYRVRAENSAGVSSWSNVQSVLVNAAQTCLPRPGSWSGTRSSSFTVTEDCKVRDFTIKVPFASSTCTISARQDLPIGDVGLHSSLAIDMQGNSAISYYDQSYGDLKYARWNGSGWVIQTVDSEGAVGRDTSLALDSAGNPHISYYDVTNSALKYAQWNGSAWQLQTVDADGTVGSNTSLALDTAGRPHISYYDVTNSALKYARWNGSTWQRQSVDSEGTVGYDTSLALDSVDNPHISYYDGTNRDLKYAGWNGSAWEIQTVDSSGTVGYYTSLALDTSGNPHISYYDSTNEALKYARWTGSTWQPQTVDSDGAVGFDTSLALDPADNPHISYYDATARDLKISQWTGSQWRTAVADSNGDVGRYSSIALAPDGTPRISFHDAIEGDLRHAVQQGAIWDRQIVDSIIADVFGVSGLSTIAGLFTSADELTGAYVVYLCGSTISIPPSSGSWTASASTLFESGIAADAGENQARYQHLLIDDMEDDIELERQKLLRPDLRTVTTTLLPADQ